MYIYIYIYIYMYNTYIYIYIYTYTYIFSFIPKGYGATIGCFLDDCMSSDKFVASEIESCAKVVVIIHT